MGSSSIRKALILCVIGTMLEWYDFSIFGGLMPVFAKIFFSENNKAASIIATFSIFAIGFLVRPLGAIIFGYVGDKFGRKLSVLASIIAMSLSTAFIGLLPTYLSIGLAAVVLLCILRVFQGLSSSGGHTGCITFLSEIVPEKKRYFLLSLGFFGVILGMLLGSVAVAIISVSLSENHFLTYGWRVLFLMGVLVGACGIYFCLKVEESAVFTRMQHRHNILKNPVMETVKQDWDKMLLVAGIFCLNALVFYTVFVYLPADLVNRAVLSRSEVFIINSLNILAMSIFIPISGLMSQKYGYEIILKISAMGFVLLSYPLFLMVNSGNLYNIAMGQFIFGLLNGFFLGPTPTLYTSLFHSSNRYSGVALGMNLAASIFGGTAPLVMGYLSELKVHLLAQSIYIILAAILALVCTRIIKSKNRLVSKVVFDDQELELR